MITEANEFQYCIVHHDAIPCLAISKTASMSALSSLASYIPLIFAYISSSEHENDNIHPSGPPFFRYRSIPIGVSSEEFVIEVGIPVSSPLFSHSASNSIEAGVEGDIRPTTLPGGRYLETTYVGPPAGLMDATRAMLEWASKNGLVFDMTMTTTTSTVAEGGRNGGASSGFQVWANRVEWYETDPAAEPDRTKWRTRLSFQLAD